MFEGILAAVIKDTVHTSAVYFLDHFRQNTNCPPLAIQQCTKEQEDHSEKECPSVPSQSDMSSLFSYNTDKNGSAENILDQNATFEDEKEDREVKSKRPVKVFDYAEISDQADPAKIFDYGVQNLKRSESCTDYSHAQASCDGKTEANQVVEEETISEEAILKPSTSLMPKRRRKSMGMRSDKMKKRKSSESFNGEQETSSRSPPKKTSPPREKIDSRSKTSLLQTSPERHSIESGKWVVPVHSPDRPRGWDRSDSKFLRKSPTKNKIERIDSRPWVWVRQSLEFKVNFFQKMSNHSVQF